MTSVGGVWVTLYSQAAEIFVLLLEYPWKFSFSRSGTESCDVVARFSLIHFIRFAGLRLY